VSDLIDHEIRAGCLRCKQIYVLVVDDFAADNSEIALPLQDFVLAVAAGQRIQPALTWQSKYSARKKQAFEVHCHVLHVEEFGPVAK
jgi:hypothetical protein